MTLYFPALWIPKSISFLTFKGTSLLGPDFGSMIQLYDYDDDYLPDWCIKNLLSLLHVVI